MQRLKDKIEKWFGEGIEYKGSKYEKIVILSPEYIVISDSNYSFHTKLQLSINDLCSRECRFLESLRRNKQYEFFDLVEDSGRSMEHYYGVQYHRMQLSLLNDENKILYILNNTK